MDKDVFDKNNNVIVSREMKEILSAYDYTDVWRIKNPEKRHYT